MVETAQQTRLRIAFVGKGGSGKSSIAGTLARLLVAEGEPVLALDCDTNANLGISLGIGEDATDRLVAVHRIEDPEPG